MVAFESPARVGVSLASLAAFDAERDVAVCRELTKKFEEVVRGPAAEVAARFAGGARGEITIVFAGDRRGVVAADSDAAVAAVAELIAAGTPRRVAADVVARLTDMSRNDLYRATL